MLIHVHANRQICLNSYKDFDNLQNLNEINFHASNTVHLSTIINKDILLDE